MFHIDGYLALAGLLVGFTVGLTGMGGGALMTPILVLLFRIQPLAAVSSDLVAAFVMKPVGGAVHLRRGTVNPRLVAWLVAGSVPSAFAGVLVLRALGEGAQVQTRIKEALGIALLLAVSTMVTRAFLNVRRHWAKADRRSGQASGDELGLESGEGCRTVAVRLLPTLLIGALGGLVVGMTSVGSGSLIIVLLLFLYPQLRASELVGTDLIQAVPLVGSAALGHLLFGDFHLDLTTSLLIGSIPGVYVGARVSARAPGKVIRRALAFVLTASGMKLLGASNVQLLGALVVASAAGPLLWRWVHATGGLRRPPGPRLSPPDETAIRLHEVGSA